jgi:hypothetical protein
MSYELTSPQIADARDFLVTGPENVALNSHIGAFLIYYAIAETYLTLILARLSDQSDMDRFEIIAKGMDARVKLERVRSLAKHYAPIGPNLDLRLKHFESKCIRTRNHLSHSWPVLGEDKNTVTFSPKGDHRKIKRSETITLDELVTLIVWLYDLRADLETAFKSLHAGEAFEVATPKSELPMPNAV